MLYICDVSMKRFLYITSILCRRKLHNILWKANYSCDKNVRNMHSVDVIDDFTTNLVDKKRSKSDREPTLIFSYLTKKSWNYSPNDDVGNFTTQQLDSLIKNMMEDDKYDQVQSMIEQCITFNLVISADLIVELLHKYSHMADLPAVLLLRKLCNSTHGDFLVSHSNFDHYVGIAHWKKGNVDIAIRLFCDVIKKNENIRNVVFSILKLFIKDIVQNSSEASNIALRKSIIDLAVNDKIHYPLLLLWECCLLSSWPREQQLAESLLEEHNFIKTHLHNKYVFIYSAALREHNEEAVLTLLQIFLKYKQMHKYTAVLRGLFNYRYSRDDHKGCLEIIKNCVALNIDLTPQQYNGFLYKFILKMNPPKAVNLEIRKMESKIFNFKF